MRAEILGRAVEGPRCCRPRAFQSGDQLILVLDPGGKEVWRKTYAGQADLYDALYRVEVDDQGQIFAVGEETVNGIHTAVVVRSVAPDGELTWSFVEPNPIPDGASIDGVALASDGAIYSVGKEQHLQEGGELVLRRHDPVDGTPLWRSSTAAGMFEARGWGVALSGSNIVAVGSAREGGGGPENPLIAVYGSRPRVSADRRHRRREVDATLRPGRPRRPGL